MKPGERARTMKAKTPKRGLRIFAMLLGLIVVSTSHASLCEASCPMFETEEVSAAPSCHDTAKKGAKDEKSSECQTGCSEVVSEFGNALVISAAFSEAPLLSATAVVSFELIAFDSPSYSGSSSRASPLSRRRLYLQTQRLLI